MNNLFQPPRTTFIQKFQKATKFYDFTYHVHKSTFKGLSSFYKQYSDIERQYADSLITLTKQTYTEMPELGRENPLLLSTIKQIVNCIQTTSQLHFNYAERLLEVSAFYNTEYLSSKKKKDNMMKVLKDRNEDEYNALREREKNRTVLNAKERDIIKMLYDNLDKLSQEENDRVHKIKEQTIIYFSLYKKVCEKQLESTSEYNLKLVKQEFQVKNPKIAQVAHQLRTQYNQYGGEQIERKSYDFNQSNIFNRQSLRASMAIKERVSRLTDNQDRFKKMLQKYQAAPDALMLMDSNDVQVGLFDSACFGKEERRKYARECNSQVLRNISYDMVDGFTRSTNADSDTMMLLQLMKASLKYKQMVQPNLNTPALGAYLQQIREQINDQEYLYHLRFLQELSKFSNSTSASVMKGNFGAFEDLIRKRQRKQISQADVLANGDLSFVVKCCILDILIDCLCVARPNEPILAEGYVDYLHVVGNFGQQFFGMGRSAPVLLMLRKLDRLTVNKASQQQLEAIINDNYFMAGLQSIPPSPAAQHAYSTWSTTILNNCTAKLLTFYSQKTTFLNYLKILLLLQKMGLAPVHNFNARDHFYSCIRCAGFNFLKSSEQCLRMFDTEVGSGGDQRLKDIVQGIQELDYAGVIGSYLNPASVEVAKLLGVGQKKVKTKLFEEFTYPLYDIVNANLTLLAEQEGVDREGYVLRLGIIFAKLDLENPQPINEYQTFFKVLKSYLQETEKDYDNLLEHSRKTELWIMEDNALATPNCIDFCSLLYKPFEFLLISLKQLEKGKKTEYTSKYSEFIKLRLNTVLKTQIIKYINFLYESLANYRNECPSLTLKPIRTTRLNLLNKESMQKQRQGFKQLTRRLFNLLFLKEQLEEMVADFIEPDVYRQMDNTIFKVDKINKIAGQSPQYRDILNNIKEIVEAVLANQERIVRRVAGITVFYHMAKIFQNLYYQEEKNAIQQFFSNSADYKLSEHTFTKYQEPLEDWFTLIVKNIPEPFRRDFQLNFSKSLYYAIEYQVLNSTKFKMPLKQAALMPYLDSDVTFLTTTMRQKYFDNTIIEQNIKVPFKYLLGDLQTDTSKLMTVFEGATLKNDKDRCKYVLVILNLRVKDERALEFVKKYKSIAQA